MRNPRGFKRGCAAGGGPYYRPTSRETLHQQVFDVSNTHPMAVLCLRDWDENGSRYVASFTTLPESSSIVIIITIASPWLDSMVLTHHGSSHIYDRLHQAMSAIIKNQHTAHFGLSSRRNGNPGRVLFSNTKSRHYPAKPSGRQRLRSENLCYFLLCRSPYQTWALLFTLSQANFLLVLVTLRVSVPAGPHCGMGLNPSRYWGRDNPIGDCLGT